MLVESSPNFIAPAEDAPRREDTPSYALRAALALRLAAPGASWPETPVPALPAPPPVAASRPPIAA